MLWSPVSQGDLRTLHCCRYVTTARALAAEPDADVSAEGDSPYGAGSHPPPDPAHPLRPSLSGELLSAHFGFLDAGLPSAWRLVPGQACPGVDGGPSPAPADAAQLDGVAAASLEVELWVFGFGQQPPTPAAAAGREPGSGASGTRLSLAEEGMLLDGRCSAPRCVVLQAVRNLVDREMCKAGHVKMGSRLILRLDGQLGDVGVRFHPHVQHGTLLCQHISVHKHDFVPVTQLDAADLAGRDVVLAPLGLPASLHIQPLARVDATVRSGSVGGR